ncbi:acyl-CoA dehydrogenase family protein [Streptomyces sp. NPDC101169]|uniref:acyl-CoA dehydrogenase family protein n=1 Tax=Streptomyces sp. NPDC101169 TaxID=3366121 RepID=UPI00381F85D1
MTDLDPALRAMRDCFADAVPDLRSRALSVDADPTAVAGHLDAPGLDIVRSATTPKRHRGRLAATPLDAYDTETCLARVVGTVELARGDAAMLTAAPGPSLAGTVVDALGSEAQQDHFYETIGDGRTWTFFGMTEPGLGSDATRLSTRLERDPDGGYRLHGTKRYISNGTRGSVGAVFARTGPSPLSIRAVLVHCPADGFTSRALDMTGLRGARISELSFDGVRVAEDMVLGSHLRLSQRGLWGVMRTFNYMRVHIAALALGTAMALTEYVREHRPALAAAEVMTARLLAARQMVYEAAASVDHDPDDQRPPSMAKLHATRLAVTTAHWAATALGPASLLDHPLLEKWSRDVYAFEFMDGTSNIQRLQIARDL